MQTQSQLSQLNTAVLFTNWTQEDFTYSWGGNPFTFKKRSSEWISVGDYEHNLGLAKHFARHLTDRELNKRGVPTDHHTREEFEKNCFIEIEKTEDVPVLEVEIHQDTGLVKAVTRVGKEDVRTGKKTKITKEVVKEEVVEEKTPAPLGKIEEKPKKAGKDDKDAFEE